MDFASVVTSGRLSKRGAILGGGPLEIVERLVFGLVDSSLIGDAWPFTSSDLGFTSISSRADLDLDREETDGERLLLKRAELREGDLEALAESSFLTLVT